MIATIGWWFRVLAGVLRVQFARGFHAQLLLGAVVSPLAAAIYILMAGHLGRTDLAAYVVIAPMLAGLWGAAITASGEAISSERGEGTLELLIAAPAPAALVAVGRVAAMTLQSLIAIPLTLVVAALLGVPLHIVEPGLFLLGVFGVTVSTGAVGLLFASLFVLARSTRLFQNVIGQPLWILSGIAFPLAMLPDETVPFSALVALTWGTLVLRGAAQGAGPGWWVGLTATLVLSALYFLVGARLFIGIERRVRADGSLASF